MVQQCSTSHFFTFHQSPPEDHPMRKLRSRRNASYHGHSRCSCQTKKSGENKIDASRKRRFFLVEFLHIGFFSGWISPSFMTFKMVSRWLRDDEFQHFMVFFVWKLATPKSNGFSSSSLFFDGHFEKPHIDTEFAQHDTCHPKRMAGWFRRVWSAKLVQITPITMVYGTHITIVTGAYIPTYNWGAPHCIYI